MGAREELAAVLRANGLTDEPHKFDGDIHSWRCSHPDIYGPCSCFGELVDDLARLLDEARREALREAADAWQIGGWSALTPPIKAETQPQRIIGAAQAVTDWLRDRAAANPYAGSEGA